MERGYDGALSIHDDDDIPQSNIGYAWAVIVSGHGRVHFVLDREGLTKLLAIGVEPFCRCPGSDEFQELHLTLQSRGPIP